MKGLARRGVQTLAFREFSNYREKEWSHLDMGSFYFLVGSTFSSLLFGSLHFCCPSLWELGNIPYVGGLHLA